jgi:Epoxide hydrolase N terminus
MSASTLSTHGSTTDVAVRPFRVDVPEDALADLRRRIAATRLPSPELVADRSQGVQLATIQELARYWASDYDWRACEARLNALPQFRPRSTGSTSTSSTCGRRTPARCR